MATTAAARKAELDFERLYLRHKRDVYRFVLRDVRDPDEAEDITQTAFLDAFRALRRGDEPQRPQAWLLTIAQNAARRRYRMRASRPPEVQLEAELAAPDREGPSAAEIRFALERLRPAQRQALVLREIGGRSYAEIAAALELSVPAVETLLFRARRALRDELDEVAPPRSKRLLAGFFAWPVLDPRWDGFASLTGWLAGRGASVKVAGVLSAAALGSGVAVHEGLPTQPEPTAQQQSAPAASGAPSASAAATVSFRAALASHTTASLRADRRRRPGAHPRAATSALGEEPVIRAAKADKLVAKAEKLVAKTENVAARAERAVARAEKRAARALGALATPR